MSSQAHSPVAVQPGTSLKGPRQRRGENDPPILIPWYTLADAPKPKRGESSDAFYSRAARYVMNNRFAIELRRIQRDGKPSYLADLPIVERRALARAYAHSLGLSVTSVAVSK